MKILLIVGLLFFGLNPMFSQDKISIKDEEPILVEIKEIGMEYIVYYLWGEKDIKYRINRNDLTKVVFDDTHDILFLDSAPVFPNSTRILKSEENNNYFVDNTWINSFWELEKYFQNDSRTSALFYRAKRHKSVAKTLGISTLVVFGGGLILLSSSGGDIYESGFWIGAMAVGLLTPALGTTALLFKLSSVNKKRQTEEIYDMRYVFHTKPVKKLDTWNLGIGATSNGIGLVAKF